VQANTLSAFVASEIGLRRTPLSPGKISVRYSCQLYLHDTTLHCGVLLFVQKVFKYILTCSVISNA
jgi:hypothetical protein